MVLSAVRGALGFLSALPVGQRRSEWEAFADSPGVIPVVGYCTGALAAVPFLLLLVIALPAALVGFLYVLFLYLVTGINHVDGLLDVADGVATHSDEAEARAAMKDSDIGVGAVLSLGIVLLGLFALGQTMALAATGGAVFRIAGLVLAAEVGAKLAMALVVVRGTAAHEGLGQLLAENADRRTGVVALVLALPALFLTWPHPAAGVALVAGGLIGIASEHWAAGRLGGINGDVAGATNEMARLGALTTGVLAWTLL